LKRFTDELNVIWKSCLTFDVRNSSISYRLFMLIQFAGMGTPLAVEKIANMISPPRIRAVCPSDPAESKSPQVAERALLFSLARRDFSGEDASDARRYARCRQAEGLGFSGSTGGHIQPPGATVIEGIVPCIWE
jgi:hypothetical protein